MMFGENSWLVADNGRDMIWNPTGNIADFAGNPVFGGQHYVYVMCNTRLKGPAETLDFPAYDADVYIILKDWLELLNSDLSLNSGMILKEAKNIHTYQQLLDVVFNFKSYMKWVEGRRPK